MVPDDITLEKLHYVLQVVMGWDNAHLHQFIVGQTYFGEVDPDFGLDVQDERRFELRQIVTGERFRFSYEYDFGDSWMHKLLVEKVLDPQPGQQYPLCIKGRRACPPEDVGGVWGYDSFLDAIQDPTHPEHEMYVEWVGDEFDPAEFNLDEVNAALRRL